MMMATSKGPLAHHTSSVDGLSLELERNFQAPSIARAEVSALCDELDLSGSTRHTLLLLVSEVVTNAVLHSGGPAEAPLALNMEISDEAITITVTDAGSGFSPIPRDPARLHGGYGLYLVDQEATRWNVDQVGGTRVWFELSRTPVRQRIEQAETGRGSKS